MTNPPDPTHRYRKEAIVDVASEMPHGHQPEHHGPMPPPPGPEGHHPAADEDKLPQMGFMDTPEAISGKLEPEAHADLDEKVRQILLSHLELERSVTHIKYLQAFDKIRIESIYSEVKKVRKAHDPKYLRLIGLYMPFAFACLLFILEEFLRHFSK